MSAHDIVAEFHTHPGRSLDGSLTASTVHGEVRVQAMSVHDWGDGNVCVDIDLHAKPVSGDASYRVWNPAPGLGGVLELIARHGAVTS